MIRSVSKRLLSGVAITTYALCILTANIHSMKCLQKWFKDKIYSLKHEKLYKVHMLTETFKIQNKSNVIHCNYFVPDNGWIKSKLWKLKKTNSWRTNTGTNQKARNIYIKSIKHNFSLSFKKTFWMRKYLYLSQCQISFLGSNST